MNKIKCVFCEHKFSDYFNVEGGETMQPDPEPDPDDSMDGDAASALASAGLGTDEDYEHGTPGLDDF